MRIGIGADHWGYNLKNEIIKNLKDKYQFVDLGTNSEENVDYVDYAIKVCEMVNKKEIEFGILICGTGIGMSIASNKIDGILCAKIDNTDEAKFSKAHNHANVISFSYKKPIKEVIEMINSFTETDFDNQERYLRRIEKIKNLE